MLPGKKTPLRPGTESTSVGRVTPSSNSMSGPLGENKDFKLLARVQYKHGRLLGEPWLQIWLGMLALVF